MSVLNELRHLLQQLRQYLARFGVSSAGEYSQDFISEGRDRGTPKNIFGTDCAPSPENSNFFHENAIFRCIFIHYV